MKIIVRTVKPDSISNDWSPDVLKARKWDELGSIIGSSDSHGLVYKVRHRSDNSVAWYEPRELILEP